MKTPAGQHVAGSPKEFELLPEPTFIRDGTDAYCNQHVETILAFNATHISADNLKVTVLENGSPVRCLQPSSQPCSCSSIGLPSHSVRASNTAPVSIQP
jgi:hypothetical protein